jgi:hypothetical protein
MTVCWGCKNTVLGYLSCTVCDGLLSTIAEQDRTTVMTDDGHAMGCSGTSKERKRQSVVIGRKVLIIVGVVIQRLELGQS